MSRIRVGILQDHYSIDPRENFYKTRDILIKNYNDADIVILPEYSMINILAGLKPEEVYQRAEPLEDSWYLSKMADLAGVLSTNILLHFVERTNQPPHVWSSSILVNMEGNIRRVYRKMHLFDAYGYRESDYFLPGNDISYGLVMKNMIFYVAICYDLRFPELFRTYAHLGAYGVFVHAGWVKGPLKEEVLASLATARSHENTIYLIVSDHTGQEYVGRSGVFNPLGYRELDLGYKPGYIEHDIYSEVVEEARKLIPVLEHSKKWDITLKTHNNNT